MVKSEVSYKKIFVNLAKIVGDNRVKKVPKAPNLLIVKPKTTEDVRRVIKLAAKEGIPIIPKRRWVLGDSSYSTGQIIMDTSDMNGIFEIDDDNLAVTVGPGVLCTELLGTLLQRGYAIGTCPGIAATTVGDWIDMGGAGIGSYSHGFAGDQVRTMEVVLPDSKIINTGFKNVLPNSSGYNLNGLFVGADSTLGLITKITLKMLPKSEKTLPLYYTFPETKDMVHALRELTRLKTTPLNISFFGKNYFKTLRLLGKDVPDIGSAVMNVTLAGLKSVVGHDEMVVDSVMKKYGVNKEDQNTAIALWDQRFFDLPPKPSGMTPVLSEVLIPASSLLEMIDDATVLIDKLKLKSVIIGTLCDRSTVSLVIYLLSDEPLSKKSRLSIVFAQKVGELALKYNGRPVGSSMFLAFDLKQIYGEGINTIMDIKSTLDPHGIMNPR